MTTAFRKAADVAAIKDKMREHHFGTAIVHKRTPGIYTYEFGKGTLAIESIVNFLIAPEPTIGAATSAVDGLIGVMRDHQLNKRLFETLFPSMSQQLSSNTQIFSISDIQGAVQRVLGKRATPGIVAVYTELTVEALADTSFVAANEGYSFREVRSVRFPTLNDLAREVTRAELVSLLKGEPIRIRVSADRFTPAYLHSEYQRIMSKVGTALSKMGYFYEHLHDALFCVYQSVMSKPNLVDRLPSAVVNSAELAEMTSNVTLVAAAFELAPKVPLGGEWSLQSSLKSTLQILNLSDRYDITALSTAVGHYRYSSVVDTRSNLIGGVISYSAPIKHKVDVAILHQQAGAIPMMSPTQLDRYSDRFNALLAGFNGWDIMDDAHQACVQLMSAVVVKEHDQNARSTLVVMGELSRGEMLHIAMANADKVYLPQLPSGKTISLDERFVFQKDLAGRRLMADEIPAEGVVYTSDPSTLLLACDSFDAPLAYDMSGQHVLDTMWQRLWLDAPSDVAHEYQKEGNVVVEVGGSNIELTLDMHTLVRLPRRDGAVMITQPFTAPVMSAALDSILATRNWVAEAPSIKASSVASTTLDAQTGYLLYSMFERPMHAGFFNDVLDRVVVDMANKVSPELRDLTYSTLEQENYRKQIETRVLLFIMRSMQLLPESAGGDIQKFWQETSFFPRMTGTRRRTREI